MNYLKYFILFLAILICKNVFSQEIIKVVKNYVLIDIDQSSDLKTNDTIDIFKRLSSGNIENVGRAKIIKFKNGQCAAKIIMENPDFRITTGDFIKINKNFKVDDIFSENNTKELSYQPNTKKQSQKQSGSLNSNFFTLTKISFFSGLAVSGLGYYFHSNANETYDDYKDASTTKEAVELYDDTISLDKKAQITLGIGGGLIGLGIINYFLNKNNNNTFSKSNFSIEPILKKNNVSLNLKFPLN